MAASVTLIRHAETTANVARLWQGQTNTEFSPSGYSQLEALAKRMAGAEYDLVVASDLGRTIATAEAVGLPFDTDERWREINVGDWEGLTYEQINERDSDRWQSFLEGRDVRLGGGERVSDVRNRITSVHHELVEQIGPNGSALVITHGLATVMAFHGALGVTTPMSIRVPVNTSLSTMESADPDTHTMVRYNDAAHLDLDEPPGHDGETRVVLVRHGQTEGNLSEHWQGHLDSPLTLLGEGQTERLGAKPPRVDVVYSSPQGRAYRTAESFGRPVNPNDELKEIAFGSWEGSTADEIRLADPEAFRQIRELGIDVARGGTGETFGGVRGRMTRAIEGFVKRHPGRRIAVVSHGGSTRAYMSGVLGLDFPAVRNAIRGLDNTAMAHVGYDKKGPALIAWNIAPHLS